MSSDVEFEEVSDFTDAYTGKSVAEISASSVWLGILSVSPRSSLVFFQLSAHINCSNLPQNATAFKLTEGFRLSAGIGQYDEGTLTINLVYPAQNEMNKESVSKAKTFCNLIWSQEDINSQVNAIQANLPNAD